MKMFFAAWLLLILMPAALAGITCYHTEEPRSFFAPVFSCEINESAGINYTCYGVTYNPADNSTLAITPRYEEVEEYGTAQAYKPLPVGGSDQAVKVLFSERRLKVGVETGFSVRCYDNSTPPGLLEYDTLLTPVNPEFYYSAEAVKAGKDNAGQVTLLIGVVSLFLLAVGSLLVVFRK